MTKVRVATFRWDNSAWQRSDIRQVNSSDLVKNKRRQGCVAMKRISKDSFKYPSKPSWKPKKSNRC